MAKKGKPFIKEPEQIKHEEIIFPVPPRVEGPKETTLRLTGAGSFFASYLRQKVLKWETLTVNETVAEKLIKKGIFEEIF
jgi:hypothetical protein